jgi:hypothetical protein
MVLACLSILLPGIDRLPLHFIESAERLWGFLGMVINDS